MSSEASRSDGTGPVAESSVGVNVAAHLPSMARFAPNNLALRVPVGTGAEGRIVYSDFTFAELDREVDARCRRLSQAGVRRDSRVLMMVKPGLELVALFFALFKIGAIPVLIDPGMGLRSFLRCVAHSRPEAIAAIPMGIWLSRIIRRPFRSVGIRYRAGGGGRRVDPGPDEVFPVAATMSDDFAAILFTSGSTGPAKGVCYEHGMFAAQVEMIRRQYGIEAGEVDLPMLPVFALFNPALGMTTVIPEMDPSRPATVDPSRIVRAIRQCGVTNSFGAPVLWRKIGRYCLENDIRLPLMRRVLMAGAPVSPGIVRDFRKILPAGEIHTPYGATECLPVSTLSGGEILDRTSPITEAGGGTCVGKVFNGIEVKIIEPAEGAIGEETAMRSLPPWEIGEIVVKGPVVTREYDALDEENRISKIPAAEGLWHRIGDMGYFDAEGRLWFCGRKAERVRTADGTLYTECCEAIFNRHPRVARSALVGFGEAGAQEPAIVVEPEKGFFPGKREEREEFIGALRELGKETGATRGIALFFFDRAFPVDVRHNAKINRRALADRYEPRWRRLHSV